MDQVSVFSGFIFLFFIFYFSPSPNFCHLATEKKSGAPLKTEFCEKKNAKVAIYFQGIIFLDSFLGLLLKRL
jgi:hypothetical protein